MGSEFLKKHIEIFEKKGNIMVIPTRHRQDVKVPHATDVLQPKVPYLRTPAQEQR